MNREPDHSDPLQGKRRSYTEVKVPDRKFPFSPRSARDLRVGDFWAVALQDGSLGCLQVTDLQESGPGALKTLVAGIIDWRGSSPPTGSEIAGRRVLAQGLTRIEAFTKINAQVLGNSNDTVRASDLASNYRDHALGTGHNVWGWRALPRVIERELGKMSLRSESS